MLKSLILSSCLCVSVLVSSVAFSNDYSSDSRRRVFRTCFSPQNPVSQPRLVTFDQQASEDAEQESCSNRNGDRLCFRNNSQQSSAFSKQCCPATQKAPFKFKHEDRVTRIFCVHDELVVTL